MLWTARSAAENSGISGPASWPGFLEFACPKTQLICPISHVNAERLWSQAACLGPAVRQQGRGTPGMPGLRRRNAGVPPVRHFAVCPIVLYACPGVRYFGPLLGQVAWVPAFGGSACDLAVHAPLNFPGRLPRHRCSAGARARAPTRTSRPSLRMGPSPLSLRMGPSHLGSARVGDEPRCSSLRHVVYTHA